MSQTDYNAQFNGSPEHKHLVILYMANVPMSDDVSEGVLHHLGSYRYGYWGMKAGTMGYLFSTGHPPLIESFIHHICNTMHGKNFGAGVMRVFDREHFTGQSDIVTPECAPFNGRGIFLDVNCKAFHIDRTVISLYELLETYKWAKGEGQIIPWCSTRDRRDGRFAFKAIMNNTFWTKRQTPPPPNEYARFLKEVLG